MRLALVIGKVKMEHGRGIKANKIAA